MFGLPLHPLAVHGAVVLIPLTLVGLVAAFVTRQWKGPVPAAISVLAIIAAVSASVAAYSGSSLEEEVEERAEAAGQDLEVDDHAEAGTRARNLAIAFAATTTIAALGTRFVARTRAQAYQDPILVVVALVGFAATWFTVDAGHSGAEMVWDGPGNFVTGQGSGGDGDGDAEQEDGEDGEDDEDDDDD